MGRIIDQDPVELDQVTVQIALGKAFDKALEKIREPLKAAGAGNPKALDDAIMQLDPLEKRALDKVAHSKEAESNNVSRFIKTSIDKLKARGAESEFPKDDMDAAKKYTEEKHAEEMTSVSPKSLMLARNDKANTPPFPS